MARPRDAYLETSPYQADAGQKVGKPPTAISVSDLRALGHPESPSKAIRAKCADCVGGNLAEVRKCVAIGCALWPYRMGVNPFYGRAGPKRRNPGAGAAGASETSDQEAGR